MVTIPVTIFLNYLKRIHQEHQARKEGMAAGLSEREVFD